MQCLRATELHDEVKVAVRMVRLPKLHNKLVGPALTKTMRPRTSIGPMAQSLITVMKTQREMVTHVTEHTTMRLSVMSCV